MAAKTRRRLLLICSAALVAVVVTGFLVPLIQKRMEQDLAPLSEIEIGEEPGSVQFSTQDGPTSQDKEE